MSPWWAFAGLVIMVVLTIVAQRMFSGHQEFRRPPRRKRRKV